MIEVTMEGLREALDMFDDLPTISTQKTVLRNTLKKAATPMVERATSNLPPAMARGGAAGWYDRGNKQALRVSTRGRRGRDFRTTVGITLNYGHRLGHLFEFGTGPRVTKAGAFRGRMPATPYVRPAYDATDDQIVERFRLEFFIQLEKAADRLLKRAMAGKLTTKQIEGLR